MNKNKEQLTREMGTRLGDSRREKGCTQEQICTELQLEGIDILAKRFSRYETGKTEIPIHVLKVLADKIYHVPLDYLVNGKHEEENKELSCLLGLLTAEQRGVVMVLLHSFLDYTKEK